MSETPEIADGVLRVLDPRFVTLQRQVGWITTAAASIVAAIGLVIFAVAGETDAWVTLGVAILVVLALGTLAWSAQRWPPIAYRHASYRVDDHGLEIRRGVFWRVVINVPRSRVQHTDVSQGPLQRQHELATLVIHTAGTDEAEVILPGLSHDTALAIRDHLLPRDAGDAL